MFAGGVLRISKIIDDSEGWETIRRVYEMLNARMQA